LIASEESLEPYLYRKVKVSGTYDFAHEMVVLNRRHASGPGQLLLTPLKLDRSNVSLIISRGFIPFRDREPDTWGKYRLAEQDSFFAVLQASVGQKTVIAPKGEAGDSAAGFTQTWLYPDVDSMAGQLPYPILTGYYLQRIGPSGTASEFPAEYIRLKVPPSTHFGYTIEWALLACASLIAGFVLQAFPAKFSRRELHQQRPADRSRSNDLSSTPRADAEQQRHDAIKNNGSIKIH
jgi:cytochrome oxidase assembly protein ShyY1